MAPRPHREGQLAVVGETATLTADYTGGEATACSIEWGDGATSSSAPVDGRCRDSHDYSDAGKPATYTATVRVTFGSGVEATDSVQVVVHPYFRARLATPMDGAAVTDRVAVRVDTQGSLVRPVLVAVEWGDQATSDCDALTCSHRYEEPGSYEIVAQTEWELLGSRLRWSDVAVVHVAPPPDSAWGVARTVDDTALSLVVRQGDKRPIGGVQVGNGRNLFRSDEVTGLTGGLGTAVVEATGSWRGAGDHTIELALVDFDGGDQATVTIRDTDGKVVLAAGGTVADGAVVIEEPGEVTAG